MNNGVASRITRLERATSDTVLRAALARNGLQSSADGHIGALLAALDDAALERLVADLRAATPPMVWERQQAWVQACSDADLAAVLAGECP